MSDKENIKQENHKQMNNLLLDVLHAWELKLMHNDCTPEEIRKCYDLVSDNLDVLVTTSVMASVQSVGNQVGMSSQQVINSIQMGNSAIAAQLAECCCNIRESIASFKGDLQLQLCQQTNALQNSLNGVNTSIERGFSTTAYETAAQTNELKNAIAAQTTFINDKFCQLEMREMQNKIDALRTENQTLRFAESQQAQNNYLISQLQPVAKPAYLTCSPYQAAQFPYCNPCGNWYNTSNNGCNCGCGY